jgi:GABA(A) receptor-associated protein
MSIKIPYKTKFSLEKRREEGEKIRQKYTDRIPIIVTPMGKAIKNDQLDKQKFLVPSDLNVAQFQAVIRKRVNLTAEEAMWIFIIGKDGKEVIPPTSATLGSLYKEYVEDTKDAPDWDGFLYVLYSGENTFGN